MTATQNQLKGKGCGLDAADEKLPARPLPFYFPLNSWLADCRCEMWYIGLAWKRNGVPTPRI
jgi:hypothetical protein